MGVLSAAAPAVTHGAFAVRRAAAQAGILVALVLTVAAGVGLGAGVWAGGSLATRDAIRDTLPGADTPEGWLQVQTRPATDRAAQIAAGDAVLADVLGADARVETVAVGEVGTDFERVAWRVTPDPAALTPEGMERLAGSLPRVLAAFRQSDAAEGGAIATGGLSEAVADVADSARATNAIVPVPIALLAVLAWIAVLQLARLLGASRGAQIRLLTARGLSTGQSATVAGAEAVTVTILGGVIGVGAAAAVVASLWPSSGMAALAALWMPVVLSLIVATATIALAHEASARGATASGRLSRAASPAVAVLVVVAGAVLIWQATTTRGAGWDAWTVAVTILAPTVGIVAVAVVALVLFGPLAAAAARMSARSRALSPVYPARQVARRLGAFSVAVALVVIAVGGAVLAGAYASTWSNASTRAADVAAGAPMRAVLDPVTSVDVQRAATVSASAAPAYTAPVAAGDVAARLVALPPSQVPEVVTDLPALAVELAAALDGGASARSLPPETTSLVLSGAIAAAVPEAAAAATVTAWLLDPAGTPTPIGLDLAITDGRFVATGDLPAADDSAPGGDAARAWSLVSIEVARSAAFVDDSLRFTDLSVAVASDEGEQVLDVDTLPSAALVPARGAQAAVSSAVVFSAGGTRPERTPAVVTYAFAAGLDLGVGDDLDVSVDGSGRRFAFTVTGVVPALPGIGSGAGVFAGLPSLVLGSVAMAGGEGVAPTPPVANEIWASGGEAADLSARLEVPVTVPAEPGATAAGGLAVLWAVAAIGGAALAGVALVALQWSAARQRAGEVLVLRALGVSPRAQSRLRTAESAIVFVFSLVLGVAGGLGLSWLLIPGMTMRTLVEVAESPSLSVHPAPVIAAVGVLAIAFAAAAIGATWAIGRQGGSTRPEEAAA